MDEKIITKNLVLAARTLLGELEGRVSKQLTVPEGKKGVVIYPDGTSKTFPPGKHEIINPIQRMMGSGVGIQAGYVPDESFPARMTALNLVSNDGELLDVVIGVVCQVEDPVHFFQRNVSERGVLGEDVEFDASHEHIRDELLYLANQYQAEDLIHGKAKEAFSLDLFRILKQYFNGQGVGLLNINLLTFVRSALKVEAQEKLQELNERLLDVELRKQMAAAETQAELNEFLDNLSPELKDSMGIHFVSPAEKREQKPENELRFPLTDSQAKMIRRWTTLEHNPEAMPGLLERLTSSIFKKKKDEKVEKIRKRWWLGRAIWMTFVFLLTGGLTLIVIALTGSANWLDKIELFIPVWAFGLGAELESVKALFEKRESIAESWSHSGITQLDDLVKKDHQQIDQLVRRECSREITQIEGIFEDVQSTVFRDGNEDLALTIRQFRRDKLEAAREQLGDPRFGTPVYLQDVKVTKGAREHMWDYDEDLILHVQALSEKAQIIQMRKSSKEISAKTVADFERDLDFFMQRFVGRARPLKMKMDGS